MRIADCGLRIADWSTLWRHQSPNKSAICNQQFAMTLFVSSFLVLFLEIALIRWMPAYVRLLSYFSNFILLATFLGVGLGCLLVGRRRNLIAWFPLAQLAVILTVKYL